jgi:hypothetical protein
MVRRNFAGRRDDNMHVHEEEDGGHRSRVHRERNDFMSIGHHVTHLADLGWHFDFGHLCDLWGFMSKFELLSAIKTCSVHCILA